MRTTYRTRCAEIILLGMVLAGAVQAQPTIRFLPSSSASEVNSVFALANGGYHINASVGRVRLSPELSVQAINRDYADYVVAMTAVNDERIEIGKLSEPFGFSGITTSLSFPATISPGCTVRRFRADETVRWYQYVRGVSCTRLSVAENGEIWLSSNADILILRADGTVRQRHLLSAMDRSFIGELIPARGVNLGGAFVRLNGYVPQTDSVAFVDATGRERWRVPTGQALNVRALVSGGVEITETTTVKTLDAAGTQLTHRPNDPIAGTIVTRTWDAQTGEQWVLSRAVECALTKLGSSGEIQWRTPLSCGVSVSRNRRWLTAEEQPSVVQVSPAAIAIVGRNELAILNHAGALAISQTVGGEGIDAVTLNAAGTELLYVRLTRSATGETERRLRRLSVRDASESAVNLPLSTRGGTPLQSLKIAPDGTYFSLTAGASDTQALLSAIEPDGEVRWQQHVDFEQNLLDASNRMVCLTRSIRGSDAPAAGESSLLCRDAATGAALFDLKPYGYFPSEQSVLNPGPARMRVYDDRVLIARPDLGNGANTFSSYLPGPNYEGISSSGERLFAFNLPGGMTDYLWGAEGLVASNSPGPTSSMVALNYLLLHGSYVGFQDSDTTLSLWNAQGQQIRSILYPYAQSALDGATALTSGLIVGRREGVRVAPNTPQTYGLELAPGNLIYEFFDLDGNLVWRRPAALFDTGFFEPGFEQNAYPIFPSAFVELKEDRREQRPALYMLRSYQGLDQAFEQRRSVLQKIDLMTGALIWRQAVNIDPTVSGSANLQAIELPEKTPDGVLQVLVYGRSLSGETWVEYIDAASGRSLDIQRPGELFPEAAVIRSGGLDFVFRQPPPPARTPQPVGAASQIGAWHNPATPGEGFYMERIGNTQFVAWLHNDWDLPEAAAAELLSPARQRWLTLQGELIAGASEVELKILQSTGGSFVQASAEVPVEVGSATLKFFSCDSATLSYELRAQRCADSSCSAEQRTGLLHGVIPLQALVPATTCAIPTSLPTPISIKTGVFHDPAISGQALVSVSNDSTFIAGWFTRDPAMAADDPHNQAWFSLQAPAPINPSETMVRAKIYRTLGGRRDSPLPVSHQEVGQATLAFPSCERMTMQYQFSDVESVKPFQNLSGVVNLERIGACR